MVFIASFLIACSGNKKGSGDNTSSTLQETGEEIIELDDKSIEKGEQHLREDYQEIVQTFIDNIKNQKKEKLSTQVSFPLKRDSPIPDIRNEREFLERYREIFDDNLIELISGSNPATDWSAMGWRGIMLKNGMLWLDYDGTLIAVNYQSQSEQQKKARLVAITKAYVHPSLKEFKQPIVVLETKKFRIRIDDLGNHKFRYASWPIEKNMNVAPDLILSNGKVIHDGSGGNHRYEFSNGPYTYVCSIITLGTSDSPPATLSIFKGDKEILSERAILAPKNQKNQIAPKKFALQVKNPNDAEKFLLDLGIRKFAKNIAAPDPELNYTFNITKAFFHILALDNVKNFYANNKDITTTVVGTVALSPNFHTLIIGFTNTSSWYDSYLVNYTKKGELIDFLEITRGDFIESYTYIESQFYPTHVIRKAYQFSVKEVIDNGKSTTIEGYEINREEKISINKEGFFGKSQHYDTPLQVE
ncbi:hypothetical protein [Sediminicola sp. 1XM1-17]|uniref:hypothetical protein n=1 Tax=Sediminicola sp. 1XM1-17 TaxID=3127702 RepID=UPI003077FAF2